VRTSSKLKPVASEKSASCSICGLPVVEGTDGIFGWGGDQNSDSEPVNGNEYGHGRVLCYGCSRSIKG